MTRQLDKTATRILRATLTGARATRLAACSILASSLLAACGSSAVSPTTATNTVDCGNVFLPVREGASWTYRTSGTAGEGTRTDTISGGDAINAFLIQTKLQDITYLQPWNCTAQGLVNLGLDRALFTGRNGVVKLEPTSVSGVTLPVKIKAGDHWTQVVAFRFESTSVAGSGTLTYAFAAMGAEKAAVPAETFTAMRIDVQATMDLAVNGGTSTIHFDSQQWWAPGSGLVKMTGSGTTGDGPRFESNLELVQHHLP